MNIFYYQNIFSVCLQKSLSRQMLLKESKKLKCYSIYFYMEYNNTYLIENSKSQDAADFYSIPIFSMKRDIK